jgi:hypothetical protein
LQLGCYVSLYHGYIQNAVLIRRLLRKSVPVILVFSRGSKGSILTRSHHRSAAPVRPVESVSNLGKEILESRVSGNIDSAISYMNKSAYAKLSDTVQGSNKLTAPEIVIYMHELTDMHLESEQPYPFRDYFHWLDHTCHILSCNKKPFAVKLHPVLTGELKKKYNNSLALLEQLVRKYDVSVMDMTTKELVKNGMKLGVTVEGSIAPELAHLGVNCLALRIAQYSDFDLCYIACNLRDYEDKLLALAAIPFGSHFRKQSYLYTGSQALMFSKTHEWDPEDVHRSSLIEARTIEKINDFF